MAVISKDLGAVTAYAAAVNRGYTGTKEEFETLMASYATVAQQAAESAQSASSSAQGAFQAASSANAAMNNARTAESNAQSAASGAQGYAQYAQQSAHSASQFAQSAESAKDTAVNAVEGFAAGAQQALDSVNQAGNNWKSLAQAKALDSEAYALGTRDGEDVGAQDETYHNNAKWYAEQGGASAQTASEAAQTATAKAGEAQASAEAAAESARTLTIDTTLTQSGQAADAKETGNKITSLKEDLDSNSKKLENKVDGAKTANLFDKSTITEGYYVGTNGLIEGSGWNASDYIEVEAGKTYSASVISNAKYYDSGYTRTGNITASPFTVPSGVKYVRFSIQDANVDTFMCVLGSTLPDSYIPYGCVLSMNSFTDEIIIGLKEKMGVPEGLINNNNYLYHLREHLSNPFVRTQIKFVGDSITAGQGGTGYDASGTSGVLIGGTKSSYQNVVSAICFSNMFYHFIADRYNHKIDVSVADERIDKPYIGKSSSLAKGEKTIDSFKIEYDRLTENNMIASRDFLSFSFYGTAFSIFNFNGSDKGKYEVYCDGSLLDTIDCYSATTEERHEQTFTGLTEGTHIVVLKTTATKNASSSLNQIVITGIGVTKFAVVVPWGISGTTSSSALNTTGRYTSDDDFVILQYGTNDRHMFFSCDSTYENLIRAAEIIKGTYGAEPIFMCPPPVDESFEYDVSVTRYFNMWDVHDAVCRVGEHYKIPVIDNYKAFMDYLDNHDNAILDDLLFDGLHPNDLGYAVIYDNIMDSLGLPRFPSYKAWPQSE